MVEMLTENQIHANRANAQRSTGPKTQEGKKRSSLNALRHGLNAQAVLLPHEDALAFDRQNQKWFNDLKPKGALEDQLVQSLADLAWRINRMRNMETNILADAYNALSGQVHPALALARAARECEDSIVKLGMHEQRATRSFERTSKQLQEIQTARRAHEKSEMSDAVLIHNMQKSKEVFWDPTDDGFVLTIPEIDAHIRRQTLIDNARRHTQSAGAAQC